MQARKFLYPIPLMFAAAACVVLIIAARLFGKNFVVSADWRLFGFAAAMAAGAGFSAWLIWLCRTGRLPGRRDGKKPGWLAFIIMLPVFCGCAWIALVPGLGVTTTSLAGVETQQTFPMHKARASRNCVILLPDETETCLKQDIFDRLPYNGEVALRGRKSWFGFLIGRN